MILCKTVYFGVCWGRHAKCGPSHDEGMVQMRILSFLLSTATLAASFVIAPTHSRLSQRLLRSQPDAWNPIDLEPDEFFEICHLDKSEMIVNCEMVPPSELPPEIVQKVQEECEDLCEPGDKEGDKRSLVFAVPGSGAEGDPKEKFVTVKDWEDCMKESTCDVPADVLLRLAGPDAAQSLRPSLADDMGLRYHMHFGAGRLGMGLVVPALSASGVPFSIVQRPKPKWRDMLINGLVSKPDITVNHHVVVPNITVIDSNAGDAPENLPPRSLIFGQDNNDLGEFVPRATSFSSSLGAAMAKVCASNVAPTAELNRQRW